MAKEATVGSIVMWWPYMNGKPNFKKPDYGIIISTGDRRLPWENESRIFYKVAPFKEPNMTRTVMDDCRGVPWMRVDSWEVVEDE
jgi:hypothetical protein